MRNINIFLPGTNLKTPSGVTL